MTAPYPASSPAGSYVSVPPEAPKHPADILQTTKAGLVEPPTKLFYT